MFRVIPLDVLAQQITAEVSAQEWPEEALFELVRRAYPYRQLARKAFDEVLAMLAAGFSTRRGRHGALIHPMTASITCCGRGAARA
jgi:ATP-dependent Lhr-like helicase